MTARLTATSEGDENDGQSGADRAIKTVERRVPIGPLATLLGAGALLGTLTKRQTSRTRQIAGGLVGAGLFALGVQRLRTEQAADGGEADGGEANRTEADADAGGNGAGETEVSDDAHAEAQQDLGAQRTADETQSVYQSETEPNPRGMSDRADVKTQQEGDVHFVDGEQPEAHRETHLEDEDAHDTRLHPESDDESTEVDLSEAAMADEISEAAGPHPEQSYPAREGTDPEPTSPEAPERVGEGAVAQTGPESEDEGASDDAEDDAEAGDAGTNEEAANDEAPNEGQETEASEDEAQESTDE